MKLGVTNVTVKGSTVIQIRGITPQDHRILVHGTRYSAIGIMNLEGIMDVHIAEGTVNGERFTYIVAETLLPILNPFDANNSLSIVIMDNASIHHVDHVVMQLNTQLMPKLFSYHHTHHT